MLRHSLPLAVAAAIALAACQRGNPPAPGEAATPAPATPRDAPAATLEDVVETRPNYIIGISYPQSAQAHPGLARALRDYADRSRGELMRAVDGLQGRKPPVPYDLSLQFTGLVDTPDIVAVAADGSSYTGGAHGNPLVERFVWLPRQQRLLKAEELLAPDAWHAVSDASREQLMTALSQRLDADELEGGERARQLEETSRMIDAGTAPSAGNFARFEPVMDVGGRIRALRFVFPPLQVGPYEEGTRSVEIPARTLLPLMQPEYRPLFVGG